MNSRDYLGQGTFQVSVLPARAAYLIKAGSRSGLRRAVQEATTRWAGMTEPIVPVKSGGAVDAWSRQLVQTADVDGLVNVDLPESDAEAAAGHLRLDLTDLSDIDRSSAVRWTCHPANISHGGRAAHLSVALCATSNGPLWEAVAAGDLTPEQEKDIARTELTVRRARTGDELGRAQLFGGTLLDLSISEFEEHRATNGPWPAPAIVWITRSKGYRDCLHFWNIRALRPLAFERMTLILLPDDCVRAWVGFDEQFSSKLDRPDVVEPDVVLCSLGVEQSRLNDIASWLRLTPSTGKLRSQRKWPPPPNRTPPYAYSLNLDPRTWVVYGREYGRAENTIAQLFRANTMIRFRSPVEFVGGGYTLVRLSSTAFDGLPRRESVARLVDSNAKWHAGSVQLAMAAQADYWFPLRIPTLAEATSAVLKDAGARHAISDKGRLGERLAAQTDVGILRAPRVYGVVRGLTTPRSKELLRELERRRGIGDADTDLVELAATWGGRANQRYRTARGLRGPAGGSCLEALEKLTSLGWVQRGLEAACDRCGLRSFVALTDSDERAPCPACGADARYSAEAGTLGVQYRLNAFIDRASDQGLLPHLLCLAELRRRHTATHLLLGLELEFPDGSTAEVDIFGVHNSMVIAGEAKTSATEFDDTSLARDVELSRRLGADMHVLVCADKIPPSVARAAALLAAEANLELLLLGPSEVWATP